MPQKGYTKDYLANLSPAEQKRLYETLTDKSLSLPEVTARLGVSNTTVRTIKKKLGIPLSKIRLRKILTVSERAQIVAYYEKLGSIKRVAKALGYSYYRAELFLRNSGVLPEQKHRRACQALHTAPDGHLHEQKFNYKDYMDDWIETSALKCEMSIPEFREFLKTEEGIRYAFNPENEYNSQKMAEFYQQTGGNCERNSQSENYGRGTNGTSGCYSASDAVPCFC